MLTKGYGVSVQLPSVFCIKIVSLKMLLLHSGVHLLHTDVYTAVVRG